MGRLKKGKEKGKGITVFVLRELGKVGIGVSKEGEDVGVRRKRTIIFKFVQKFETKNRRR